MWLILNFALGAPIDAESVRDGMSEHWSAAVEARDAVVAGDLAAVKTAATRWAAADKGEAQLLLDSRDRLEPRFDALVRAKDLAAAGAAVGELAAACAACHKENEVHRSYEPPKPPESTASMEHHRAGAEYMWAGLVSGSRPLFDAGAATLASGNLVRSGLPTGGEVDQAAQALEVQVQDLAARARRTDDGVERARLFGKMLGTCATCHEVTHGGPASVGIPVQGATPLVSEMHERFAVLSAARDAVRAGDLAGAQAHGQALMSLQPPTGLPMQPWRPWVVEVRANAADLAASKSLYDAGLAVSRLAASCGGCHVAVEGGPAVPQRDALEGRDGMELLWIGLLTESDSAWMLGAEMVGTKRLLQTPPGDARARAFARFITP